MKHTHRSFLCIRIDRLAPRAAKVIALAALLVIQSALCSLSLSLAAAAPEPPADSSVLIECGSYEWSYAVMSAGEFAALGEDWYKGDTGELLSDKHTAPFGDRLIPGRDLETGWTGDDHVILLSGSFNLDSAASFAGMHLYAYMYFDNTIKVYINDSEVFSNELWNSGYDRFELSAECLVSGKNTVEISVADDLGGREFDLTLLLSPTEITDLPPSGGDNEKDDNDSQGKTDSSSATAKTTAPTTTEAPAALTGDGQSIFCDSDNYMSLGSAVLILVLTLILSSLPVAAAIIYTERRLKK